LLSIASNPLCTKLKNLFGFGHLISKTASLLTKPSGLAPAFLPKENECRYCGNECEGEYCSKECYFNDINE